MTAHRENFFRFEELRVYQEAEVLVHWVYQLLRKLPAQYRYTLADQLQRAVLSILLNIAEGSSRTKRDFQHFLTIARGSCFECVAILRVARSENLINDGEFEWSYKKLADLANMLGALRSKV